MIHMRKTLQHSTKLEKDFLFETTEDLVETGEWTKAHRKQSNYLVKPILRVIPSLAVKPKQNEPEPIVSTRRKTNNVFVPLPKLVPIAKPVWRPSAVAVKPLPPVSVKTETP